MPWINDEDVLLPPSKRAVKVIKITNYRILKK